MNHIIDRQTFVFSVNLNGLNPSLIQTQVNLRFAADELILKNLTYNNVGAGDTDDVVQIWCDRTNDGLLCSFGNNTTIYQYHDDRFRLNNTFQTGNITFQFQQTASGAPFYYNPQPLISSQGGGSHTVGVVSFTVEFIKYSK
jgi:hypothetical protein